MARSAPRGLGLLLTLFALRSIGFVGQERALPRRGRAPRHAAQDLVLRKLTPVVLCPAQFGTREDYEELKVNLEERGFALYAAPLSRLDWLRIVPSTFTKEFFTAELRPRKTLGFFYEALDQAMREVEQDYGPEEPVAFLGHSIGGWVARSYIGEVLGDQAMRRVRSLVTLGTPHQPPPAESVVAALDQTRGLLTYINEKFPSGSPLNTSLVTCVAGSGTKTPASMEVMMEGVGEKLWNQTQNRSTFLEEVVALASYLPLSGSTFDVEGDGLIPVETALMEGRGKRLSWMIATMPTSCPCPGRACGCPSPTNGMAPRDLSTRGPSFCEGRISLGARFHV
ncbi:unnamed protein product [Durusdinium trenchii]|uniref:GPI inositol-deacylase n=1 Tax=Durusdinium trenchii TaxID=1381693 RepID=A0ABP0KMF7_9DINO